MNVHPRQYIAHLKTVWVILDKRIKDELTKNFYRGWNDTEEHITGFARRLDDEQAKLASDSLKSVHMTSYNITCCRCGTAPYSTNIR